MAAVSRLVERRVVACPYYLAQRYLAQAAGGVPGKPEKESALTLGVSGPRFDISKNVRVSFSPADPEHYDRPWRIHWTPQSGPYPEFEGELTIAPTRPMRLPRSNCRVRISRREVYSVLHSIGSPGRESPLLLRKISCAASATGSRRVTRAMSKLRKTRKLDLPLRQECSLR